MPPREVTLSKGPANPAPLIIKNDSEANQKKSQETFKKNPEADAYVKKLIEKGCCPIITNVAALETTKGGSALSKNETEKISKNKDKASIEKENIKKENEIIFKNEKSNPNQSNRLAEKMNLKTFSSTVTVINANPPQKTKTELQNTTLVFSEKVSIENPSNHSVVSNKVSEHKTISPVSISTLQNPAPESKPASQNHFVSFQTAPSTNPPQISSTAPAVLINPTPQINILPQVVPALNTVLLTQLIPQRLIPNGREMKSFGDFLPVKNVKQNLIEPEKFQFSTPLISTKVLTQILANKDTTSLNTLRAILHLFGREIEKEKDETDLEGSYGLWKEYLKKIKRKKSKQALSQNRQQKTQSSDKEELGIRS
jgi:hypothetical protein